LVEHFGIRANGTDGDIKNTKLKTLEFCTSYKKIPYAQSNKGSLTDRKEGAKQLTNGRNRLTSYELYYESINIHLIAISLSYKNEKKKKSKKPNRTKIGTLTTFRAAQKVHVEAIYVLSTPLIQIDVLYCVVHKYFEYYQNPTM